MKLAKAVLDTNVVVSAFLSRRGASYDLLSAAASGAFEMLASPTLFLEYEEVLKRPEIRLSSGMSLRKIDRTLRDIAAIVVPVELHYSWRPQLRDPDDEMVLEAAVNGGAEAIVTFNVKDFEPAQGFNILAMTPQKFLKRIKR